MNTEKVYLFVLLTFFSESENEWFRLKVNIPWQTLNTIFFRQVLDILYQTEDGFAVPDEEDCPPPPEDEEY